MTGGEDYDLVSHFNEGSYDEEEEYQPIPKNEEEEEAPSSKCGYTIPTTPRTFPEVRSRNSSPSGFVNKSNNSHGNSGRGIPTIQIVPRMNRITRNDIKLPIFNGNGLEDLEQHWFLCKAIWTR